MLITFPYAITFLRLINFSFIFLSRMKKALGQYANIPIVWLKSHRCDESFDMKNITTRLAWYAFSRFFYFYLLIFFSIFLFFTLAPFSYPLTVIYVSMIYIWTRVINCDHLTVNFPIFIWRNYKIFNLYSLGKMKNFWPYAS